MTVFLTPQQNWLKLNRFSYLISSEFPGFKFSGTITKPIFWEYQGQRDSKLSNNQKSANLSDVDGRWAPRVLPISWVLFASCGWSEWLRHLGPCCFEYFLEWRERMRAAKWTSVISVMFFWCHWIWISVRIMFISKWYHDLVRSGRMNSIKFHTVLNLT